MSTLTKKIRDELLVNGYVRTETKPHALDIAEAIIDLIFVWYHIYSFFMTAGDHCTINERKDAVEFKKRVNNFKGNSCYGSLVMASISDVDIEYVFKLKIKRSENIVGIGIDDARCKWPNENYTMAGNPYNGTMTNIIHTLVQVVSIHGMFEMERDLDQIILSEIL